jgi:hypothetical protein
MTNRMLLLEFTVTRSQPPQVVIADAYWAPSPVAWRSVEAFVAHWECVALCERLRKFAALCMADRVEVAC